VETRVVEEVTVTELVLEEVTMTKLALDEVVVGVTGKVAVVADIVASTYSSALKIEE
jgi:hypothetical protein